MERMKFASMTLGLCMLACSDPGGTGTLSGGGGSSSGGASPLSSGGSGGTSTSTGGASVGAGAAGGATGLLGCPTWPLAKLMPVVGPRFYGPDPGPCRSQYFGATNQTQALELVEYVYDSEGNVTSDTDLISGAQATYTWRDGVLVSYSSVSSSLSLDYAVTYDYGVGYASSQPSATSSGNAVRYTLTANGYPLTAVSTNMTTGAIQQTVTYLYDGCRLQGRRAIRADGTSLPSADLTYEYDAAGHMVRRISLDGSYDEYDYSCWTK